MVILGLFFCLIVFMVFYIWIYNYTNQLLTSVEDLRHEEVLLVNQNKMLSAEIENLNRADRIKKIAAQELNMVTPAPETLAVIIEQDIIKP